MDNARVIKRRKRPEMKRYVPPGRRHVEQQIDCVVFDEKPKTTTIQNTIPSESWDGEEYNTKMSSSYDQQSDWDELKSAEKSETPLTYECSKQSAMENDDSSYSSYTPKADINLKIKTIETCVKGLASCNNPQNSILIAINGLQEVFNKPCLGESHQQMIGTVLCSLLEFILKNIVFCSSNALDDISSLMATVGYVLEEKYPHELDRLFNLIRDRFIDSSTSKEQRQYLMEMLESRAMGWVPRYE
ncbi:uncharacterized protein LOC5506334 [Nematostella vectensis]|nr:uncharacterized protein LOC5506334 [Nematostella vectensis]